MPNPSVHLQTLRDLLRYAVTSFEKAKLVYGHGTTRAFDEAAFLLLHTLHLPIDELQPYLDARLLPDEIKRCLEIIERRIMERKPAAYLTNEAWLADQKFYVDERVLIPRSHIAELIQTDFQPWIADSIQIKSALDLCTGSGCLAILVAQQFPQAEIIASDISTNALQVAQRNVQDYQLQAQIQLIESDLFTQLLKNLRFDIIISNPPYVTQPSMQNLPPEYRHEPYGALASGEDGLDCVEKILKQAPQFLTANGIMIVEIGDNRANFEKRFPNLEVTWLETSNSVDCVFLLQN